MSWLSALQSMGCHIDFTHTGFSLHLAGAFGHWMVREKEYCLESGTEVGLGITGEGAGEDRLTLALYCLGTKALGPLLRARPEPISSWHLAGLFSPTPNKSKVRSGFD